MSDKKLDTSNFQFVNDRVVASGTSLCPTFSSLIMFGKEEFQMEFTSPFDVNDDLTEQAAKEICRRLKEYGRLLDTIEGLHKALRKANSFAERAGSEYADEDAHFVGEWLDEGKEVLKENGINQKTE
jgi:hypothetical protein